MNYRNYLGPDNPVVSIKVKDYGTITLELFIKLPLTPLATSFH